MPKPTPSPADLMKLHGEAIERGGAAATTALEGMRRLAALNMETARASLEESTEQIRALLSTRDVNTLTELVSSLARLSPEKFTAYANAVYAISSETGSELRAMLEKQIAESNDQLTATVEALAQNTPGGQDGTFDFISKSLDAARAAYAQMQSAAQQFTQSPTPGAGAGGGGAAKGKKHAAGSR